MNNGEREMLARIDERTKRIDNRLQRSIKQRQLLQEEVDEHDDRIQSIEGQVRSVKWLAGAIGAAVAVAWANILDFFHIT